MTRTGSRSYILLARHVFDRVNGMDERFVGWGPEDLAFLISVTKQVGPITELGGARVHLWHADDPTKRNRLQLHENRRRVGMYRRAAPVTVARLAREYGRWDEPRHGTP